MNSIRLGTVTAVVLLLFGCQSLRVGKQTSAPADTAARNKELVRRFYTDVFVNWNMAIVDELVAPQFTSHDWPERSATGPRAFRDFYAGLRAAFPDTRYTVEDLVSEGDKVVVRWRLNATHKGEFRGVAATGRQITLRGVAIYRVQGGKLMERWVVVDLLGLMEQIQAPTAP